MDSTNTETQETIIEPIFYEEIRHVPLWVKGIVAVGVLLSLIQLLDFKSSLMDAVHKRRASAAYAEGKYMQAVALYTDLHARHLKDKDLIKSLGYAQYHAGEYFNALRTFDLLVGEMMNKDDIEKIHSVISDIDSKLSNQEGA